MRIKFNHTVNGWILRTYITIPHQQLSDEITCSYDFNNKEGSGIIDYKNKELILGEPIEIEPYDDKKGKPKIIKKIKLPKEAFLQLKSHFI